MCPFCYNNAPFKGMPSGSGCNSCTHPTCPNSLTLLGVSNCDECDRGILVLDCTSAPKKYKLGCNVCDVIINIFKGASKVTVLESKFEHGENFARNFDTNFYFCLTFFCHRQASNAMSANRS